VIGFETALAVVLELVREGALTPLQLVAALTWNPARILKLAAGRLERGAPGDVVVIDPSARWLYDPAKGFSKSRNSPWAGRTLEGRALATFVDGRLVYHADRGVLAP
jgi:dihydroorotase